MPKKKHKKKIAKRVTPPAPPEKEKESKFLERCPITKKRYALSKTIKIDGAVISLEGLKLCLNPTGYGYFCNMLNRYGIRKDVPV